MDNLENGTKQTVEPELKVYFFYLFFNIFCSI